MSQNPSDNNRTLLYLLGVVVVLLVVIVALVFTRTQTPGTNVTSAASPTQAAPQSGTQMPGVAPSTGAFDVKTATKVPSGTDPKVYVTTYYQSILDKKWETAFKMQPAASQANGTAKDFEQTQISYGMKSFKVLSSTAQGDTAVVTVQQDLGTNGVWGATWTFVKNGSDWVVKERKVSMGGS
jgi:hypothetical protein